MHDCGSHGSEIEFFLNTLNPHLYTSDLINPFLTTDVLSLFVTEKRALSLPLDQKSVGPCQDGKILLKHTIYP